MTIYLCHEGRKLGTFSTEQVEAMLKGGVITGDTLAWTPGLAEWKRLREILAPPTPPPISGHTTEGGYESVLSQPKTPKSGTKTSDAPKPPIMENTSVGIVLDEAPRIQAHDAKLLPDLLRPMFQRMAVLRPEFCDCKLPALPPLLDANNQLPEATGEFGTSPNNPIPVNGPVGLTAYLNTLRSDRGRPFAQMYQGTVINKLNNGIVDAVFLQELTDQSPREFFLFFYLYSKRRSPRLPAFCYRVPMEPTAEGSSWQLGYKQPFMLKLAGSIPLLGVGNAIYGAAGILRTIDGKLRSEGEGGKWVACHDSHVIKKGTAQIERLWLNNVHALALVTDWEGNLRSVGDVLKDEARLRKLPNEAAEHYWEETFGKEGEMKPMGSGANPEDPIVLWPMNNMAAAVIERGIFLEAIFEKEDVDWIGEERRYPGGSILEYHVRRKNGERRVVYFDLSRLNENVDNKQNRNAKQIVEKEVGIAVNSKAPCDISSRFHTFYVLNSQSEEEWKRFIVAGDLRTQPSGHAMNSAGDKPSGIREPLMTRLQWQRWVREAEFAVEALEKQNGRALPVWRENLRLMKANSPKEFAPPVYRSLWMRLLMFVFPPTQAGLDQVILDDWKAGKPPQLPPERASENKKDNHPAIPPVIGAN